MTTPKTNNIILDGALLSQLRADIEDVFQVISVDTPRQASQGTILFTGQLLNPDSEVAYDIIAQRWQVHDYTPIMRYHANKKDIILMAQPGVLEAKPSDPRINLALAVLTIASVWFTGALVECQCFPSSLDSWLGGLPMALALMVILLAHEFGHYFAARYHKVAVTLPYFIPLPLISPVGTLGAFIQLRSPFKTKKQLFDIGVAGPLGGLIFALPLIFWIVANSPVRPITRGPLIVTGSADQTAALWDISTEQEIYRFSGHTEAVNSASFSSDGQFVVTSAADQTIRLWEANTGEALFSFKGHTGAINGADMGVKHPTLLTILFGSDDQIIVTASDDQTARLWDATNGQELQRFEGHQDTIQSVALNPYAATVVTAGADQSARVWDLTTGQELLKLDDHTGAVNSASFNPSLNLSIFIGTEKSTIVTASDDQTARIWSGATGREIRRFEGHTGAVNSAAFSPDGQTIVTASDDQTARLWEVETGRELQRFEGHNAEVTAAAFASQGQIIVTSSHDQSTRLWDVTSGKEIQHFENHTAAINSLDSRDIGSVLEGNSIFYLLVKYSIFGQLIPSFDAYADLPFVQEFVLLLIGDIPEGGGTDIFINALGFAAWFGLFITAMNLLPVGQLDGGHVVYCLIGEKAQALGTVLVGLMVVAGLVWWPGWLIWAILTFFVIGVQHPPPLNDLVPLNLWRKVLAYIIIILVIILFMPNPLQFL